MDRERILAMLRREEGYAKKLPDGGCAAYQDTKGIWTIGYGYNLESHGYSKAEAAKVVWTRAQADAALAAEADAAIAQVRAEIPWASELSDARHAVLVCMAYQMGIDGLRQFVRTLPMIRDGRYQDAADNMLLSKWARSDSQARAHRAAEMMVSGEFAPWVDQYLGANDA